jgi:membrane protein implicated in regulation of membrane protease activity
MSEPTLWWLLAGALVAFELLSGTFYLLMLAPGAVAAALAAHTGLSLTTQIVAWHWKRMRHNHEPPAQANANVNLDIGETVQIAAWNADGTASVQYRGAHWTAIHRTGVIPTPGAHRVAEMAGSRLLVDKT